MQQVEIVVVENVWNVRCLIFAHIYYNEPNTSVNMCANVYDNTLHTIYTHIHINMLFTNEQYPKIIK